MRRYDGLTQVCIDEGIKEPSSLNFGPRTAHSTSLTFLTTPLSSNLLLPCNSPPTSLASPSSRLPWLVLAQPCPSLL